MRDLIIYLIGINVVTFLIYGIDKWKARRGKSGASLKTPSSGWPSPEAASAHS